MNRHQRGSVQDHVWPDGVGQAVPRALRHAHNAGAWRRALRAHCVCAFPPSVHKSAV